MLSAEIVMPLKDKKGLITGIANSQSVAYGCAEAFSPKRALPLPI
jgi:enoyl-[acyl-carrier-protein] reductase (NADH)